MNQTRSLSEFSRPSEFTRHVAIARPAGVHYNHCVCPSVHRTFADRIVKMLITLEPHRIF